MVATIKKVIQQQNRKHFNVRGGMLTVSLDTGPENRVEIHFIKGDNSMRITHMEYNSKKEAVECYDTLRDLLKKFRVD